MEKWELNAVTIRHKWMHNNGHTVAAISSSFLPGAAQQLRCWPSARTYCSICLSWPVAILIGPRVGVKYFKCNLRV